MSNCLRLAIFGFFVWIFATLFFVLFGEYVLYPPGENGYVLSLTILLLATGLLLFFVTKIYMVFDKTKYAPLKFGLAGTIIGLTLDMVSLSNYELVFQNLKPTQVISFTSWMSFAYALYIIIPLIISLRDVGKTDKVKVFKNV